MINKDVLINPYHKGINFTNFPDLDKKIIKYYDILVDTYYDESELYKILTPRFKIEGGLKIGIRDIFYYIDLLYSNSPKKVIDIGCGECMWKNWFPNIIGFDVTTSSFSQADFVDFFDEDFVKNHYESFDAGLALNSIHFVSWEKINEQLNLAMQLLKPTGRLLFTINFAQLDNNSDSKSGIVNCSLEEKFNYIFDIVSNLKYTKIVVDSPVHRGVPYDKAKQVEYINGTIRIILEK